MEHRQDHDGHIVGSWYSTKHPSRNLNSHKERVGSHPGMDQHILGPVYFPTPFNYFSFDA